MDRTTVLENETPHALTQQELDRRIGDVAETVFSVPADTQPTAEGTLQPQWIAASELVRRMAPFMVQN